jgi:hypothetical protein
MQGSKSLSRLLWILTAVPPIITAVTELNKRVLIWHFRIVDFIDLTLLAPFFCVLLFFLHRNIFSEQGISNWSWISLGFIAMFLYGHAMHLTANSISTFSIEIRNYGEVIPKDSYELIYFLDEILGHWLVYIGLFGAIAVWTAKSKSQTTSFLPNFICGSLFGLAYSISIIESTLVWVGLLIFIVLITSISYNAKYVIFSSYKNGLMSSFSLGAAIFMLLGELAYYLVVGSFIEPSKLGF